MRKYLIPRSAATFARSVVIRSLPRSFCCPTAKNLRKPRSGGRPLGLLTAMLSRYPIRPRERHARHRRRLDRQRHQVLRLEVVDMALAAGPGDGLRLERQHREVVGESAPGRDRIEALGKL